MKRIAFFQDSLGVGGIQKSIINLLNNLDYTKVSVDLYLSRQDEFWQADFPTGVTVKYLPPIARIASFMPFDLALKLFAPKLDDVNEPYDVAIDFNSYQFSCAAGAITIPAKRRVMWIHNNVEIKYQNEWKYRVLWTCFKGKFKYYDKFIAVSKALIEPFKRQSKMHEKTFDYIHNYIDVCDIREKAKLTPEGFHVDDNCFNLVAVGRLCHQKGYDIMLDAFAKAYAKRPDLRLYIIGGGDDMQSLKEQRESLGISEVVHFLGNQKNPFAYMQCMDAMLSTSRYEGQPLNIMEAMVVGLPVYCTKNLEQYTDGLVGYDDIVEALVNAPKTAKKPDDLAAYNSRILDAIYALANS